MFSKLNIQPNGAQNKKNEIKIITSVQLNLRDYKKYESY